MPQLPCLYTWKPSPPGTGVRGTPTVIYSILLATYSMISSLRRAESSGGAVSVSKESYWTNWWSYEVTSGAAPLVLVPSIPSSFQTSLEPSSIFWQLLFASGPLLGLALVWPSLGLGACDSGTPAHVRIMCLLCHVTSLEPCRLSLPVMFATV